MAGDAVTELVSYAADLEQRDRMAAAELEALAELAGRAADVAARGTELRSALERIPGELEDVGRRTYEAEAETDAALEQLRLADERLASLERSRRRRTDETERARREAATVRELLADAHAQAERLRARGEQLNADERALVEEAAGLSGTAAGIASELRRHPRIGDAAVREPGETLAELEDWGALVRSALFVARGTLEAERERIVAEANGLGATVLGEDLGASSVALVRRRLETELGR
jgi:hypothetical protein